MKKVNGKWSRIIAIILVLVLTVCAQQSSSWATDVDGGDEQLGIATDTDAVPEENEEVLSEDAEETEDAEEAEEVELAFDDSTLESEDVSDEQETSEEEVVELVNPAFSDSKSVDGVKVKVEASEGVFSEGATLSVTKVAGSEEDKVSNAVDAVRDDSVNVIKTYTFDIKILDENGVEIQPADGQTVNVSFELDEVSNQNLTADVYHIPEEDGSLVAEELRTSESGNTVIAVSDGFSYYQVEFTYGEKQYVLPGDESVALTDILAYVGITNKDGSAATDESITSATGSDDSLFTVKKENGIWTATAVTAFSSNESLAVTVDGVDYEIVVTDDAKSYWARYIAVNTEINLKDQICRDIYKHSTYTTYYQYGLVIYIDNVYAWGSLEGSGGFTSNNENGWTSNGEYIVKNKTQHTDNSAINQGYSQGYAWTVYLESAKVDVTGISLNKSDTTIPYGSYETLEATVEPSDASDKTVKWSSDNPSVATVDSTGKVTPVSPGTATITATATNGTVDTDDDAEATCTVTVTKGEGSISYTTDPVNKTYDDAVFTNELTNTGDGSVTYVSSNEDVATVNSTGQVTITGAGTATITANVEDSDNYDYATKTATYTLNVSKATMTVSANDYDAAYDGNEHGISIDVIKPTSGYTIKYGTTEGTYDLDDCPTITDVNDSPLTIYYKITAPNYNDITGSKTVTITKAGAATSTAPKAKTDLTYTGEDQYLINEGLTGDGTLKYSLDGVVYSTNIPKGKDVGSYTVYYMVVGDDNHNDSTPRTITVNINPVDKDALERLIAEATDYYDIIKTYDDYTGIAEELKDAIDEAQDVDDDDNITGQQVRDAIDDLQDALDKAKADVVSVIINKLPSPNDVTTEHNDEIEAAREAFDDLTDDQKEKVSDSTKKKLYDDEAALLNKTKEAAKEKLKEKYDGLVATDDYDKEGLEELKNAYDDAVAAIEAATVTDTEDAPKNNGPWKEEKSGERALDAVKTAVAKITEIINNLPDPDDVTKEHKDDIKNARKVYDGLTDRQKRQVPDDLKNKLENDEIALVIALIDNLPEPEDVTTDDKDDIEDARKAYDSLTPEQQRQIPDDTKTKFEDDEAALLERVKETAKEELKKKYDELAGSGDYDEDGLKELKDAYEEAVDAIDNATVPDSKDKPKKNGPWNKEKSGEDALDAVKTAADKVIDAINNLPDSEDVTADDREVIEAARKAYDELTDEQKAQVNPKALKKLIDDENALKTAKIIYSAIEGDGSNWEKGDSNGDKFVFKRNVNDYKTFEEFTGILVDGDKVDSSNYTAEAGSVIIILKPEYLETLSVGKHTLTAQFTDAEDVTVVFEVLAKGASNAETAVTAPDKNANNHIDTGDKMNIKLVVMLMISSCLAALYLSIRWRKIR